jgi:PhzF family phenazine biosynthesis protein
MKIKIYQVDAFTKKVFSGNPAAVCPLEYWLNDDMLQKIAMENNLAETAFYVQKEDYFEIRWFTPTIEVDLCGHATLAAAFVLFNHENYKHDEIKFISPRSGSLTVRKRDHLLSLNFPTDTITSITINKEIIESFSIAPIEAYQGKTDFLLIYNNETQIRDIIPFFDKIEKLNVRGVIVSAKGDEVDFVSRFFAPQSGIMEDPVTGSAHTTLIPYWAKILNKNSFSAKQLSKRQGDLTCKLLQKRVEISGEAKLYLEGEIYLDE